MERFTKIILGLASIVTAAACFEGIGERIGEAKERKEIAQMLRQEVLQAEQNAAVYAELRPRHAHPPQFYECMKIAEVYRNLAENLK
ncbi:hypothetical protein KY342_03895 [Candidatus Woesearchaeota archaeon]|nr:hypothetical protein [Candidatus Woesearchaeota archaeon]